MKNSKELELTERNLQIIQMSKDGRGLKAIAEQFELSVSHVNKIIVDALKIARLEYEDTARELWVKNYYRTETILDRLMEEIFLVEGKEGTNYAAIDRVERYISLQNKMLLSYNDMSGIQKEQGQYNQINVFTSGSAEYTKYLEAAQSDPTYLPPQKVIDGNWEVSSTDH